MLRKIITAALFSSQVVSGFVLPPNVTSSNTKLDIVGLADGSLGILPAQMLVYQGLLAQLKADNSAPALKAPQDDNGAQ